MSNKKNRLTEQMLREAGLEGVIRDYLPKINEIINTQVDEIERLTGELQIQQIRNEEQLKLVESLVKGLKQPMIYIPLEGENK